MKARTAFRIFSLFLLIVACAEDDTQLDAALSNSFRGQLVSLQHYGGSLDDRAAALVSLDAGGFAVLGTAQSVDGMLAGKTRAGEDYWLLRLDDSGNISQSLTFGGNDGDVATDLIATSDGGFLMGGYSMSADGDASKNEGFHDTWFVKTNASGGIEWEKSYGFAGHDHSYSVIQTEDGGYFSAGYLDVTASGGAGNENSKHGVGEFWGQKLDASGNLEWRNYFGGSNNDRSYKALQTPDGGFMLIGFTESDDFDISQTHGSYDYWIVKLSKTGGMQWEKTFGGSGIDIAYDAVFLSNGDCLIVGQSNSTDGDVTASNGDFDAWVMRIDAAGNLKWQRSFGGADFEFARSITPGPDNSFFIIGNSRSADTTSNGNAGANDIWVFQVDSEGQLLWQETWGGEGIDLGTDAVYSEKGILYVLATTASSSVESASGFGKDDLILLQLR
ncbi:hypothetical protein [Leeuwenhoekiella sp. H156]|uniref:hypothetical protein n=1 Tax=Leeuwenhoekiella sp. H156 TaxID=3450128 RepID=UPI003FA477ED